MQNHWCTIYVVRHGQTEFNVARKIQGQLDSPLTQKGIEQAKQLSAELSNEKFEMIFSSDLLRAQRTAEIINVDKQLALNTTKLLRERRFGRYDGTSYEEFDKLNKELILKREKLTDEDYFKFRLYEDFETDEEVVSRMITFLREVAVTYSGKNILAVTHGGSMRALLVHLGLGSYNEITHESISNSAYVKLLSDGIEFKILETKGITKYFNERSK